MGAEDAERAAALAALAANDGNVTKTGRQIGVPPSTLRRWRENPPSPDAVEEKARALEEILQSALEIMADDLETAYPKFAERNKIRLFGVTLDKIIALRQLEAGIGQAHPAGGVSSLVTLVQNMQITSERGGNDQ